MGCGISSSFDSRHHDTRPPNIITDPNSKIINNGKGVQAQLKGDDVVSSPTNNNHKHGQDQDDDDTRISYSSHITSPSLLIGSPSFRDYVVQDSLKREIVIDNITGKNGGGKKRENNIASNEVSSRSNVAAAIEKTSGQRFRNFMNKSSCYNTNSNVSARSNQVTNLPHQNES